MGFRTKFVRFQNPFDLAARVTSHAPDPHMRALSADCSLCVIPSFGRLQAVRCSAVQCSAAPRVAQVRRHPTDLTPRRHRHAATGRRRTDSFLFPRAGLRRAGLPNPRPIYVASAN